MTRDTELSGESGGGILCVVATPIGNLGDITARAVEWLTLADLVVAEDTRHSSRLLDHLGLSKKLMALHEHNEDQQVPRLLDKLRAGERLVLISDAGTPLISDPGFVLVREARKEGMAVTTAPGPCAAIAALSVAGLPTDRFAFEGFLPAKKVARETRLQGLVAEQRTLVFYESPRRIRATVEALCTVFGDDRPGVAVRELTKTFETVYHGPLASLAGQLAADDNAEKGEYVLIVQGAPAPEAGDELTADAERWLLRLLEEMPVKAAARVVADMTGMRRNDLYQRALELRRE